ncbi:hypothetical protein J8860_19050, partial [Klebsiella pneumoniae]
SICVGISCKRMTKLAQIWKVDFDMTTQVEEGHQTVEQSAQKDTGFARRRGGGARARKGGKGGGRIVRQSRPVAR